MKIPALRRGVYQGVMAWVGMMVLISCSAPDARIRSAIPVDGWLPAEHRAVSIPKPEEKPTPAEETAPDESENPTADDEEDREGGKMGDTSSIPPEEGTETIDLARVLKLASSKGLLIEIARERAAGATAESELALAKLLPTAGPRYSFFRHSGEIQSTEGTFLDVYKQNTFVGGALEIEFEPVADWYGVQAARQRIDSSLYQITAAGHETIREAAVRYFSLIGAHAEINIARQAIQHAEELLALAEARERQGMGLRSDTLRARARLAGTESDLSRAQGSAGVASARLAEILLLDEGIRLVPANSDPQISDSLDATGPLGVLLERAYATRPDLAAAAAEVLARESELSAAKSWVFPTVHAESRVGAFGRYEGGLKDRQSYFVEVGWKFGGAIAGKYHRALASHREAELGRELLKRRIASEVGAAQIAVQTARSAYEAAEREVAAAEEGLQLARSRFEAGEGLLLEVIDVQALLARARSNRAWAVLAYNHGQFDLLHAVGGPGR